MIDETPSSVRPVPAVGVVCFKGDEVLLIKRGKPPRMGEWSLPGGRIEPGETAKAAALRELFEETHVEADLIELVDVVDAIFKDDLNAQLKRHYVLIDYVAEWKAGLPQAGDDAVDAKFVSMSDLAPLKLWSKTSEIIQTAYKIYKA